MLHTISLTSTAACVALMQRKSCQPWPSWLPLVFFCNEWIKPGDEQATAWFGRKHIKSLWFLCLLWRKHSPVFHLGFASRKPNSSALEGLEGWAGAAHCPSWEHLCGGALQGSFALGQMKTHRPSMEVPDPLFWGSCMSYLMFDTHTLLGSKAVNVGPTTQGLHRATSLLQEQKSAESLI